MARAKPCDFQRATKVDVLECAGGTALSRCSPKSAARSSVIGALAAKSVFVCNSVPA